MIEHFHFDQPLWLLALVPLGLVFWVLIRQNSDTSGWQSIIDKKLQPLLLSGSGERQIHSGLAILGMSWLVAVLALANPVWQRRPVPVFQTRTASVIVLDLSRSMTIPDINPSRLARAKFKVEDILTRQQEGLVGLVVFAGDAFTVSPLTRDNDTLLALLESLSSRMMPVQGSRADLGLEKAADLMRQAGITTGHIILIADGAEEKSTPKVAAGLNREGYIISVLGVGTSAGGPIPQLRDARDKPVVVSLQSDVLKDIALSGGGVYRTIQGSDQDIRALLKAATKIDSHDARRSEDLQQENWEAEGPFLLFLLIPLAALAFRRGWLLSLSLLVLLGLQVPQSAQALSLDNLWQRQEQRAWKALQQGQFEQADILATNPVIRGSALYKSGNYAGAAESFAREKGPDASYNLGNALAKLGKYKEALKAYDDALQQQPEMTDARDNRDKVQELLDKQEQKKKQDKQQSSSDNSSDKEKKNDGQDGKGKQGEKKQQADKDQGSKNGESGKDNSGGQEQEASGQKSGGKESNQFADANKKRDKSAEEQDADVEKAETHPDGEAEKDQQAAGSVKEADSQDDGQKTDEEMQAAAEADNLSREERMAAEQWLRRIPDDPGGLMRRKFKYQYQQRSHAASGKTPW